MVVIMSRPCFLRRMTKHRALSEEALRLVAQRFAVLAEPMRLRLIQALFDGEKNVSQLVALTAGTQANISRHLQTLTAAHILRRRKEGLQVYYSVSDPTIPKLCEVVCGAIEKQLAKQAKHFESQG
jgi:DNA-binding transcriptional ArsR family regulator